MAVKTGKPKKVAAKKAGEKVTKASAKNQKEKKTQSKGKTKEIMPLASPEEWEFDLKVEKNDSGGPSQIIGEFKITMEKGENNHRTMVSVKGKRQSFLKGIVDNYEGAKNTLKIRTHRWDGYKDYNEDGLSGDQKKTVLDAVAKECKKLWKETKEANKQSKKQEAKEMAKEENNK